jgi:hypothetical protein
MTQTAKLTASDGMEFDELGSAVATSGHTVVAGARFATVGRNFGQGAAYVFVEPASGWVDMAQTAKLTASDGVAGAELGSAVATSGNTVMAGGSGANQRQGATYVFGSTQIPFSRFGGGLLIDPDAGVFYLSGGFKLGARGQHQSCHRTGDLQRRQLFGDAAARRLCQVQDRLCVPEDGQPYLPVCVYQIHQHAG